MSEVGLTDLSKLLHTKRHQNNAIVTSRKRKLSELHTVATRGDTQFRDAHPNNDAHAPTPLEESFLQANDISQAKKLNEATIPPRQNAPYIALRKSLVSHGFAAPASRISPSLDSQRRTASPTNIQPSHPIKAPQPIRPNVSAQSHPAPSPAGPQVDTVPTTTTQRISPSAVARASAPKVPWTAIQQSRAAAQAQAQAQAARASATPPLVSSPANTPSPAPAPGSQVEKPVGDANQRRPAQVTFPPGTKGSPASAATNTPEPVPKTEQNASTPTQTAPATSEDGVALKAATDTTRAPDVPSSPESTVRSATTPAVHDASTDTSPEHAGPAYNEPNEAKDQDGDVDAGSQGTLPDVTTNEPQDSGAIVSAEDQLLQESIRSNDDAADVPEEPTNVSADAKNDERETPSKETTPPKEEIIAEGQAVILEPPAVAKKEAAEIPDSREETPDQMDVDKPAQKDSEGVLDKPNPEVSSVNVAQPTASTSTETKQPPKESLQPAQRAVTRVSSGAMRPRSVNEIVGGPPKLNSTFDRANSTKDLEDQLTPLTAASQSPGSRSRPVSSGRRDRPKGQVSAVLFGKQPKRPDEMAKSAPAKDGSHAYDDYYLPLFIQGFSRSNKWMPPLEALLFHANKTVDTSDASLAIQDHQACKVLHRIYHLQNNDKWSLRQPKRCPEPTRPAAHWDSLLQEAKWMRTDFREERKWKTAVARNLAQACADWCAASPEDRKMMQVPAMIPPKSLVTEDTAMAEDASSDGHDIESTPGLIPGDVASPQQPEELLEVFSETISPSAIFALHEDDVVFGLRRTAAADQLLGELPMYGAPLKVPHNDPLAPDFDPDARWRRPALPLSKYVEGPMKLIQEGPPFKRSRYDYEDEEDDEMDEPASKGQSTRQTKLPPTTDEVALFRPELKHIRDRLHAGHQFRPPTDHPMPNQSFYECRNASMWTQTEDDELRSLVREYSYNWPLISDMLKSKSIFSSGAERRTPWECFERWITLEGLPSDMQKTSYFRAYNSRIEQAQRIVMQNQLAISQSQTAGGPPQPIRRRPTTPMRVERRRNQKHLALMDAMRKLAKKRETAAQKAQHTATQQNAANKKPTEVPAPRANKTPAEYSKLRWERDQALAEKMAQFAARQEAARRVALHQAQSRSQGQGAQGQPAAAGMQPGQNAQHPNTNAANGVPRPTSGAGAAGRQTQPRMPMQAPSNNMAAGAQGQMAPNVNMNYHMNNAAAQQNVQNGQQRIATPGQQQQPDAGMMMRAQRISEQQRQAVLLQQAQQHQLQHQQNQQHQQQHPGNTNTPRPASQHNSPPNMTNGVNGSMANTNGVNGTMNGAMNGVNGVNQQNFMNNGQAMMGFNNVNTNANTVNANGHTSPPTNMYMGAGSPGSRVQMPAAFQNHINQLEAQIRSKNPSMKPEAARQMAVDHMARAMLAQRQNAMNAAAGATGTTGTTGVAGAVGVAGQPHAVTNNLAATTSPHQYAQLLRQQQQAQAAQNQQATPQAAGTPSAASPPAAAQATSHNRQSSEGATPGATAPAR